MPFALFYRHTRATNPHLSAVFVTMWPTKEKNDDYWWAGVSGNAKRQRKGGVATAKGGVAEDSKNKAQQHKVIEDVKNWESAAIFKIGK